MRPLLLVTLLLAVTACAPSTPDVPEAPVVPEKTWGTLTFHFSKVNAHGEQVPEEFTDTTNVRVRVSNRFTSLNVVQDVPVDEAHTIEFRVPALKTYPYTVEVLTYATKGAYAYYRKEGRQMGVTVNPDAEARLNLLLQREKVTVTVPPTVRSGESFTGTLSGQSQHIDYCYMLPTTTPLQRNQFFRSTPAFLNQSFSLMAPHSAGAAVMDVYANCIMELRTYWSDPLSSTPFLVHPVPDLDIGEAPARAWFEAPGD